MAATFHDSRLPLTRVSIAKRLLLAITTTRYFGTKKKQSSIEFLQKVNRGKRNDQKYHCQLQMYVKM